MALTRANVESILIQRCGKLLTAADLDGVTVDGSNASLNDPIGYALRKAGYTVASAVAVADADLSGIAADDTDQLLDLAELRALENALGNYDDVDIRVGQRSEDLADLAAQLEKAIERKRRWVEREYGIGLGTLSAGVIALGFQEQNEDE